MKRTTMAVCISLAAGFLIGYAAGMGRTVEDFESCMNRQSGTLAERVTTCQGYWDREWTKRKEWRQ